MSQHTLIVFIRPALAGLGLALWMLRQSSGMRGLPGCGAGSGCDAVTRSRWARWCGVPVAGPAALLYLVLLAGFSYLSFSPPGQFRDMVRTALFPAAPLLAAAAAWFIGLQAIGIRRFCFYCLVRQVLGSAIARGGVVALVLGQVLVEPRMYRVVVSGQWSVVRGSGKDAVHAVSGGGAPDHW